MLLFLVVIVLYAILKILNLVEPAKPPTLFFGNGKHGDFVEQIIQLCPILRKRLEFVGCCINYSFVVLKFQHHV